MLLLLACSEVSADRVLAYTRADDGSYTIAPVELPELTNQTHMLGSLGDIAYGGRLSTDSDGVVSYTGGVELTVQGSVHTVDGYATRVPFDQDGLLLYSYYAHLASARNAVDAHGVDVSQIFPMSAAWNPAVSPTFELTPADNAAYATGANFFVLLPDGGDRDVPLLANQGVITHEFGHAVFHLLTAGAPMASPITEDPTVEAYFWQSSLHEGFADTLATLLLDDPGFIEVSVDLPGRRVDGVAVMTTEMLPSQRMDTLALLDDPYALGTVYASFAWDLREGSDPDTALGIVFDAIAAWSPQGEADMDGELYLEYLISAADDVGLGDLACERAEVRFAELNPSCP